MCTVDSDARILMVVALKDQSSKTKLAGFWFLPNWHWSWTREKVTW